MDQESITSETPLSALFPVPLRAKSRTAGQRLERRARRSLPPLVLPRLAEGRRMQGAASSPCSELPAHRTRLTLDARYHRLIWLFIFS